MLTHNLIVITILSGPGFGAMVNTTSLTNRKSCEVFLSAAAEGINSAYKAKAMAVHKTTLVERDESGWTVIRSGMNLEIARLKCIGIKNGTPP